MGTFFSGSAQVDSLVHTTSTDTALSTISDTIKIDTLTTDSIHNPTSGNGYRISEDAITQNIKFQSEDSLIFNNVDKIIELYDDARVTSSPLKLQSGFIKLDMQHNIIYAGGIKDSTGRLSEYPDMNMGKEKFRAKELKYNLQSGKGIILNSYRKQNDLYIRSEKTKFIKDGDKKILYNANGTITTCDLPVPHYGIVSHKQKVILDEIAVIGPSNIELGGIPTPLWIPFGFFPIEPGRRTGIVFPKDYEYSRQLGFGLNNVGYYFPISDYIDLIATTDIYLRGTFRIHLNSRYAKRYKYNGNISLNYSSIREEIINKKAGEISIDRIPSFGISIVHNQDQKAHPTWNFGGSVNIQSNGYKERNFNDAESVLQNSLSSNLSYTQYFYDNSVTLTAGMTHSQNTATNEISITFPNINLNVRRLFPFKNEKKIGKPKWYEGISFKYDASFKATLQTQDTLLFTQETLDKIRMGMLHEFSSDHTFNILKYIHVRPAINFSTAIYPSTVRKELIDEYKIKMDTTFDTEGNVVAIVNDTLQYGIVNEYKVGGIRMQNLFDASINLNTTLYGTIRFKKGWLRGLRHVVKPYLNMNYSPDYQKWGYINEYRTDLRPEESRLERYSIFEDGIYRGPSFNPVLGMSYGINNVFEAKIFSRKDSSEKEISLLPRLSISSSYNFIADSMKMSPINFNGNFTLFKNFSTVTFNGGFSMYKKNAEGKLVDEYLWENGNGFLRFEGFQVNVNTGFTIKQLRDLILGIGRSSSDKKKNASNVLDIFNNLRVYHTMQFTYDHIIDRDTFFISSHAVNVSGKIPLSENWNIDIGRIGYSFQQGRITYPDLGFSRDLHCWSMGLRWQPVRGSYSFYLRVDPGTLDFLKIPYQKNQFDENEAFF